MDVSELVRRFVEPPSTVQVRALIGDASHGLDPEQRVAVERWSNDVPLEQGLLRALRHQELAPAAMHKHASRLARRPQDVSPLDERVGHLAHLLDFAVERPATVSAIAWHWLGASHPDLATHVVQLIRERAGLPGVRERLTADEPYSRSGGDAIHVAWFADRQLEDAASWLEHVPAPAADTLAAATRANEARRAQQRAILELTPFLRQVASFVLHLSRRELDPLGFPLGSDAQLHVDPPLAQRLELAAWARRARRTLCLRGQLIVMPIRVEAPWPLSLEVIAAELGCGGRGFGLIMRLRGDASVPAATMAPVFLHLPAESIEERGARFERWLSRAYPHAVDAWRAWS